MKKQEKGFTLLEMMLVITIMASVMVMIVGFVTQKTDEMRRDRVSLQVQQILNAGLSFYLNNNRFPNNAADVGAATSELVAGGYITSGIRNPWGQVFSTTKNDTTGTFSVTTNVVKNIEATVVAGRLPMSSTSAATVTAMVGVPGQNLNNARAFNFGSVYHSGACVPVPTCPANMTPDIMVVPSQAYGIMDAPTCGSPNAISSCNAVNTYPISGFTARAILGSPGTTVLPGCTTGAMETCFATQGPWGGTPLPSSGSGRYWRVCLSVLTDRGYVTPSGSNAVAWGQGMGSVLALTRCVPSNEANTSSDFTVWAP
jgi:prepilin-type N-terminal cleavage/methylation domain-containing protein